MTHKRTQHSHALVIFRLFLAILAVSFALVASGAMASDTPLFLPAVTYFSGGAPAYSVAVADVNGDAKPDLVVANCSPTHICGGGNGVVGVLLGNGDGTFQPAVTYRAGGAQTASVAIADLNGDGKPDLVVANSYYSNTVGVLMGKGDGTFRSVVTYSSGGGGPWSVVVADANGDGKPDILAANQSSCYGCTDGGLVGVLLNKGNGTFLPAVTYGSGGYSLYNRVSLAVKDLNGDGKLDLVITNACGGSGDCSEVSSVGVLLGNGDGTFQPAVAYLSGGSSAYSVAVADVNGDDKPDLLVTNGCPNSGSCGPCTIGVLLGHGDGTFQPVALYSSGGDSANSVAAADVNGDGKPDLVVANACGNGNCGVGNPGIVGVLLGRGDGTFQEPLTYSSGGYWIADFIAVADVNGDLKPDLLAVNLQGYKDGGGSVGVLLNSTPFDTTPPVITLSATPKVLWPPNGRMVPVRISGKMTDTGSGVNAKTAGYTVKDEYGQVQPRGR